MACMKVETLCKYTYKIRNTTFVLVITINKKILSEIVYSVFKHISNIISLLKMTNYSKQTFKI